MKSESISTVLLASLLLATPATILLAQTEQQRLNEAMQLQRAIHSQETAGNLDAAIAIYREVAGTRTADRALAAEAQYRLSQALLQKGDLPGASLEMLLLSNNFPDQAERIGEIVGSSRGPYAGQSPVTPGLGAVFQSGGRAASPAQRAEVERLLHELQIAQGSAAPPAMHDLDALSGAELLALRNRLAETLAVANLPSAAYDGDFVEGGRRTITTVVENMSWTNPQSWLRISDGATQWALLLPAPNRLIRLGMNRTSLPVDAQILVTFTADSRNTPLADGSLLGRVESVVRIADQVTVFDRATMLAQAEREAAERAAAEAATPAGR